MWVGSAHKTKCSSSSLVHGSIDLMLVDIPKGLLVPNISPSHLVQEKNEHVTDKGEAIFEFAYSLLHDDATLLIFVHEFKKVKDDVRSFALTYHFILMHDWWDVNEMELCWNLVENSFTLFHKSKPLKVMSVLIVFFLYLALKNVQ